MAYITKKHGRNYIVDSYKEPILDEKGIHKKDANGKPLYRYKKKWIRSSKNNNLASIELGKYEENKDRDRIGLDKKDTPWKVVEQNYLNFSKAKKSNSTFKLDSMVFKNLNEYAKITTVQDITLHFAEKFEEWLRNKGNAEGTIRRKCITLKNIGRKIVEWGILGDNPLKNFKIPKVKKEKEVKYWKNPEDIKYVIDNTTGIWKTITVIGFYIGARLSEILNIVWEFVDFEKDTIKIESLVSAENDSSFRTKSRKFRIIKMPPILKSYLLQLKAEQQKNKNIKTNKVVVYGDGSLPTMGSCSSFLRGKFRKLGFANYHVHCLRHTFAAQYLHKYKDIYGLSKILGHYSVSMTEQHYGHLLENYFDKSMAVFDIL
jgi:integrase